MWQLGGRALHTSSSPWTSGVARQALLVAKAERGQVETHQTPCDLGSGLHTITPPRSPGQSKSHGHAPLPSLVEGVGKFMWQGAGLEGQNQVHDAPYPSLEAHLVESSFTAPFPFAGSGGAWRTMPFPSTPSP